MTCRGLAVALLVLSLGDARAEKCRNTGAIEQLALGRPPVVCTSDDESANRREAIGRGERTLGVVGGAAVGAAVVGGAVAIGAMVLSAPVSVPLVIGAAAVGAVGGGVAGGYVVSARQIAGR